MSFKFAGSGSALPDKIVTNDDLASTMDTSDECITERTGIKERRVGSSTLELATKAAEAAMERTFGVKPLPSREGGSIPIVALFEKELKVKTVLMGFGLNSDDIHSPNEHFGLFNYYRGIETIPYFFEEYVKLKG